MYYVQFRLIGKRVVDFLLAIRELFSLVSTAEALRANIDWKLSFFNDEVNLAPNYT